jgi:hypothetical protein
MFLTVNFQFGGTFANTGNTFTNCLTYQVTPNPNINLNDPATGNTATGTISNTNPLFVTPMPGWNGTTFLITWNPLLTAGSPAFNAGTDGKHIGVYGGGLPYRFSSEPDVPVVRKVQINNSVIPGNGTLNVKVIATKPQ